jgi:hypothetical protein
MRPDWLPAVLVPTLLLGLVLAAVLWGEDLLRPLGDAWVFVVLWGSAAAFAAMALFLPKGWLVPAPVVPVCVFFFWLWRATLPACESDLPRQVAALGAQQTGSIVPAMQGCLHLEGLGILFLGFWTLGGALVGLAFRPVLAWFRPRRRLPAT